MEPPPPFTFTPEQDLLRQAMEQILLAEEYPPVIYRDDYRYDKKEGEKPASRDPKYLDWKSLPVTHSEVIDAEGGEKMRLNYASQDEMGNRYIWIETHVAVKAPLPEVGSIDIYRYKNGDHEFVARVPIHHSDYYSMRVEMNASLGTPPEEYGRFDSRYPVYATMRPTQPPPYD